MIKSLIESIIHEEILSVIFEGKEEDEVMKVMEDSCLLTFSNENTKVGDQVATFSLPAGWTCPYAKDCVVKVSRERERDPETGTIKYEKGEDIKHMCYAAWQELQRDALQSNRWHNYDLLEDAKSLGEKVDLIERSLKYHFATEGKVPQVRIHESGDFYNGEYFDAWLEVAKRNSDIKFYAYTKALPFVKRNEEKIKQTPNFVLTLSKGGTRDELLGDIDIKNVTVYNSPEEALAANHIIDLDDTIAQDLEAGDFGLLVHGMQTKDIDNPDITKHKTRNETFMKYHKNKKKLNDLFGKPEDYKFTTDQARKYVEVLKKRIADGKGRKKFTEGLISLFRNVIRYNNYKFDDSLLAILPEKYR